MPRLFSISTIAAFLHPHSRHWVSLVFLTLFLWLHSGISLAQTFQDPGFTAELVTTLSPYKAVGLTFAPDGRMFIWEDDGVVRIFKNGELLTTPFLDIVSRVNTIGDRGLLGFALDPNFPTNGYFYLYYTYENDPAGNPYDPRTQRLTRMKVSATNPDIADPDSEIILLGQLGAGPCDQYPEGSDCIGADIDSHIGGTIRFAPDGKIFISTGDAASYNYPDERALRAQSLNHYEGKILRLNPDGSAPTDNPFYDGTNSARSRVYAYGLRNPYRFAVHPETGEPYVGDVGWDIFEEVNRGRGANFGWPCYEGPNPQPLYQQQFAQCQALPATAVTQPLHAYDHAFGQAIIGGTFYTGTQFPGSYYHNFFFADYTAHWIHRMALNADGSIAGVELFASNVVEPVSLEQGPDGSLYYISLASGEVRRIRYGANTLPTAIASASPASGDSPLTVNFSSAGSSAPDGEQLSYLWNFDDGSSSTEASPSHTYTVSTTTIFRVRLVVSSASGTSAPAIVNVTVNGENANQPPVATITAPAAGASFPAGTVVTYQASATDPDESLPASAYKWNILLHHDDHIHPLLESIGPSGSFVVESHANGTYYYELVLTVTDSGGLTDTKRVNLTVAATPNDGQLPSPWVSTDVGATQPGSASFANGTFTVRGGGPDIWGELDGFHFAQQQITGDFTFTARVVSLENTDYWAKAGLMIRGDLSAGSRNLYNTINPEAGAWVQFRNAPGDITNEIYTGQFRAPLWIRLVRAGNLIEAWQSVDGANWQRVASQTTTLPTTVHIGLAVSSHNDNVLATATFDNVRVNSDNPQNQSPVVSLTSPADNAVFDAPASFTISATAADEDGTIARVEFYQGTVKLGEDTTAPYSFDWNNISPGTYSLTARATDNVGATTTSVAINVSVNAVNANQPPVATITTPAAGASFPAGTVVTYQASATDPDESLPASAYKWNILLHHDDHIHPLLESIGPSGSFVVESHANGTYYYELVLTVTDSGGLTDTKRVSLAATTTTSGNGQLPSPWISTDVGATQAGNASFANGTFTVRGGGPDIWGELDGFHFAQQQITGDFTFTARVVSLENTDYWAKAGLMIRGDLSAGSRNLYNLVNPEAGAWVQFRNAPGDITNEVYTSRSRAPLWMRLVRAGNLIEAWQSVDGANWERVASQTTTLPTTVYIGLAVSSHNDNVLATATFDNVRVTR